ncbi:MAG: hypothetical protein LBG64_03815 [Pseudomonadales bacterium]|jgi:NAD(P)H-flavin reductase|nr:hypothetical protein [Pseudomonadales bacterium]
MTTLSTPQLFKARLEERIDLNDRYSEYHFELVSPNEIIRVPGQYVSIKIDDKTWRSYSMTDRSDITHGFELLVDHQPDGVGTNYLKNLSFGDEVDVLGPLGHFTLNATVAKATTLIATGSGIAPVRAMLLNLLQLSRDDRPIKLYWGMRYESELFWLDEMLELQEGFANFTFVPVISKPSENWTLSTGRVTDMLKHDELLKDSDYYLCGRQQMIEQCVEILTTNRQILSTDIFSEQFDT